MLPTATNAAQGCGGRDQRGHVQVRHVVQTTTSNPDTHQLTSVLLGVAADSGVSPRVAIHADNGGSPAASAVTNGTLTAPASVSDVLGAPERAEFTASPAISLAGGTRYWVVRRRRLRIRQAERQHDCRR